MHRRALLLLLNSSTSSIGHSFDFPLQSDFSLSSTGVRIFLPSLFLSAKCCKSPTNPNLKLKSQFTIGQDYRQIWITQNRTFSYLCGEENCLLHQEHSTGSEYQ